MRREIVEKQDKIKWFITTFNSREDYLNLYYHYGEETTFGDNIKEYPCKALVFEQHKYGFISDCHNYWDNEWIERYIIKYDNLKNLPFEIDETKLKDEQYLDMIYYAFSKKYKY